jgi:hypothetical protein
VLSHKRLLTRLARACYVRIDAPARRARPLVHP